MRMNIYIQMHVHRHVISTEVIRSWYFPCPCKPACNEGETSTRGGGRKASGRQVWCAQVSKERRERALCDTENVWENVIASTRGAHKGHERSGMRAVPVTESPVQNWGPCC